MASQGFGDLPSTMSNYSIYYLSANTNAVRSNCSVYSLPLGQLSYTDYSSGVFAANVTRFLPAYYITNCSISDLAQRIAEQNIDPSDVSAWMRRFHENPYNEADNGDAYVALLYMLSGSCVSSWMLMLLLMLSPRHKRKPLLTQLAILAFSVYLTVLLVDVTREVEAGYYADSLDMVRVWNIVMARRFSAAAVAVSFATHLAYLQLVWSFCNHHWRRVVTGSVAAVACLSVATGACLVSRSRSVERFAQNIDGWRVSHVALNFLFVSCVAVCLAYYSVFGTGAAPREVPYSRKLLPMAVLVWFIILLYLVMSMLRITLWRNNWLVHLWVTSVPPLLDVFILVTAWEWHHSIKHLKSRLELGNMLGRRISVDDVMDFNTGSPVKRATRGRFSFLAFRRPPAAAAAASIRSNSVELSDWVATPHIVTDAASVQEVHYGGSDLWDSDEDDAETRTGWGGVSPTTVQNTHETAPDTARETAPDTTHGATHETTHETPQHTPNTPNTSTDPHHNFAAAHTWGSDVLGSSAEHEQLPPFTPHPGYSKDDYWDDK